jgi:acetyl-CoA carboxylase biotin carboxyl carrier protein
MARIPIKAEVTGRVWKILVPVGGRVEADEPVLVVESMKMEIPVASEKAGTVAELLVAEDEAVEDGEVIGYVET